MKFLKTCPNLKSLVLLASVSLVGLCPAQLALIRQGDESSGVPEIGDQYGSAVALGDFNGDGFEDLATGAPIEKVGASDNQSGFVTINWGTRQGLTWENAKGLSLLDGGLAQNEVAWMGAALAVGDFDNNGCDDLAVGLPARTVNGQTTAGSVMVYYGNEDGLSQAPQLLDQGDFSASIESGDLFGKALATGRFGGGAYDDLVIGSPGENEARGAVFIVRGSAFGLANSTKEILLGEDLGGSSAPGDRFGSAIAVGNIAGSIYPELVVGAPNSKALGTLSNWGHAYVVRGTVSGLSSNEDEMKVYSAMASGEAFAENVQFGTSFAIGDFYGDGEPYDLAVGAPGAHLGGRVYLGRGGNGDVTWMDALSQINGSDEVGDDFGFALAAGDHDDDGDDDLVVGSPGESFQGNAQVSAGAVYLFSGSNAGLDENEADRILSSHLDGNTIATKWFGRSLDLGRTSQSARESIVVGAPLASGGGEVYDIAPWRQLDRPRCNTALSVDCAGEVIYALRPFESVRVASTTKIMTLLLGCEATQRPGNDPLRVELNESYAIEPWMYQAFPSTSNSSMYLFTPLPANRPPEEYTFNELLRILFPPSGNDVSYAIADMMFGDINQWEGFENTAPGFVDLMNQRAQEIGMKDTVFTNPAGVDAGEAFSTAYDMYLLGKEAMENELFSEIADSPQFLVAKLMNQSPGVFNEVQVILTYQWLLNMKQRDSRIIGLKPGGTPEAARTGVVAARPTPNSQNLVFANGFGWSNGVESRDQLAELAQMALERCSLSQEGPSDDLAPPISNGPWFAGNAELQGIQFGNFEGGEEAPGLPIDLISWAPEAPDGACLPLSWNYSALWMIAPGEEVGIDTQALRHLDGTLRNVTGEYLEGVSSVQVELVADALGGELLIQTLPEQAALLLPAVQAAREASRFRVKNLGLEPIYLKYEGVFSAEMKYDQGFFRASLTPESPPVLESHTIVESDKEIPVFEARVVIESRGEGLRYLPKPEIMEYDFSPAEDPQGAMAAYIKLKGVDGELVPLRAFYRAVAVEVSESMEPGSWRSIGEWPLEGEGPYEMRNTLPAGLKLFTRLTGVEPDEID